MLGETETLCKRVSLQSAILPTTIDSSSQTKVNRLKMVIKSLQVMMSLIILIYAVTAASSCISCDGVDVTCVDGECLPRCVSVTSTGECLQCRDFRFYGKQCENVCPPTCLSSRCQLDNSRVVCTDGCVAGKKGDNCAVDCPKSCTRCERYGDRCTGVCSKQQYYGDYCDMTCPVGCTDGCEKITGHCHNCQTGYTGDYCNKSCPVGCTHGCEKSTERCYGCKPGYTGKLCDKCKPGHTGSSCTIICSSGCTDNCHVDTDNCDKCVEGYKGKYCNDTCPPHCKDGCDQGTGVCNNCKTGYTGSTCDMVCPSSCKRGCDMYSGKCVTEDDSQIVGYVLVTVAVIMCLAFIGFVIWIRRRNRKKRMDDVTFITTLPKQKVRKKRRKAINSQGWDFENTIYEGVTGIRAIPRVNPCKELKDENSEVHMKQEFLALPKPEVQSSHCGRLSENYSKNRYKDILPFDSTRVCLALEEEEESDYINASYIDGYKQTTQYIATQGPTEGIMEDFWRMIWQGDVVKIVMLTNLVEDGNVKCEMYWPDCDKDYCTYGDVSVQCVEEKVFEYYTVRSLAVWKANCQTRKVTQFHYTSWPAHGVPQEVTSLIDFYKVVKNTSSDVKGLTLVHCSAGVGRTGTFLALVCLIDQARYEGRACVYSCVHDIRFQRMKMVNTQEQYLFLYRVLIGALQTRGILPDNSVPVWLQCKKCWETDKQRPVVNGVMMVYNHLDRNQSNSNASLDAVLV